MSKHYGTAIRKIRTGTILDVQLEDSLEVATALAEAYNRTRADYILPFEMVVVRLKVIG